MQALRKKLIGEKFGDSSENKRDGLMILVLVTRYA